MALPNTGVSVALVRKELGAATNDVAGLCVHPNINKWSRWKPVIADQTEPLTEADMIEASCGLSRNPQTQTITYLSPRGGIYGEYFRLDDFRGYNKLAVPPVNVEIIGVRHMPTGSGGSGSYLSGPPYNLVIGEDYTIEFKLIPGDIDPLWISPETSRIKNTDTDGGYGGLTWVSNPSNIEEERLPAEVFSCELLNPPTYEQRLNGINGEVRVQYCYYKNSYIDKYGTTPHYIEDNGYYDSYRSLFIASNISAGIDMSTNFTLSYLLSQLSVRIGIYNNEDFDVNVKVKLEYKRIETGTTYYFDSGAFILEDGYNGLRFLGPLTGWSVGYNSYEIKAWMYRIKSDLSEVEISYRMMTANITIQSGG